MIILIVNDDGYDADGINVLAEVFCKDYDIYMVSPESERSCFSHSVTVRKKLRYNILPNKNFKACSISGTPADCVKFGIMNFMKGIKPDLILSGINSGPNMGADVMYSGTVAAASEGVFNGVASIAVSITDRTAKKSDYNIVANKILQNINYLYGMASEGKGKYLLNVNVPPMQDLKGFKVVKAGQTLYNEEYYADCSEDNCVILTGCPLAKDLKEECDFSVTSAGFASVTPIVIDKNDYSAIEKLKGLKK